jgi:cytochrome c-type biogenesis protein CcmH/NrfG
MPDDREQVAARAMVVAVLMLGALVTIGFLGLRAAPSGGPPRPMEDAQVLTLAQLEQRAAEDPEDPATRLAIGHEHFDRSDYDLALTEYLAVLDRQPRHMRAMARAGWIAFEGGDSRLAERLVSEALEVAPDDPEALWFLAHVRMYGLGRPADAIGPLRELAARDDLSDGFRAQVDQLLAAARTGQDDR